MIRYERQESHEGAQRAVKAITDDANAEMEALQEMIVECELEIELPKERDEDGNFSFIIPGSIVGEFADLVWDIDNGELENLCEIWNAQTIDEAVGDK